MRTGEPVESLSLSKFLVLYMRKYQITFHCCFQKLLTIGTQEMNQWLLLLKPGQKLIKDWLDAEEEFNLYLNLFRFQGLLDNYVLVFFL